MRALFEYGPGIPRYLGLWLVLAPVLVLGLLALRVPRPAVAVAFLSTLPSLARNPPWWFEMPARIWLLAAALGATAWWLTGVVRAPAAAGDDAAGERVQAPPRRPGVDRRAVVALVALALVLRVPLGWWDPGISDIPTATEIAAEQLLDGDNPYTLPNPDTQVGEYQYPAGSILVHLPFVAAVPDEVLGEEHVGVRAALWATEASAVALLAWAGALAGRRRGGVAAAFAYAVHPAVLREAGQTVANDLVLALLALASAVALARRRPLLAGALAGAALSVKPAAAVLVPLLLVAAGWRAALVAVAVPLAVQAPFLLWPTVGLHGADAIVEPVGRPDTLEVLRAYSMWWPVYAWRGNGEGVVDAVQAVAVAAASGAAVWAGLAVRRRGPSLQRAAAAVALPLFVSFALASMQRTNYQGWYLAPLLLAVGMAVPVRARTPAPTAVAA